MKCNCCLCKKLICKYEMDWNSSGGISIPVGEKDKQKDICSDCAKAIAVEVVNGYYT